MNSNGILTEYELGRSITGIEWVACGAKPIIEINSRKLPSERINQLARDVRHCLDLAGQRVVRGFIVRMNGNWWSFGFYRYDWAINAFLYLQTKNPRIQGVNAHWVRGLLFGYDAEAIERFSSSSRAGQDSNWQQPLCRSSPSLRRVGIYDPSALIVPRRSNRNGKSPILH
jgi:hypothetical protein